MARNIGEPIIINTDNKTKSAKSNQTRKRNIGEPIILSDSSIPNQVQLPSFEDLLSAGPKGASKLLGDNLKKQVQSKTTIPSVNYDESYVKELELKKDIENLEKKFSEYSKIKKERDDYYNNLVSNGRGLVGSSLKEINAKKDKKYLAYNKQLEKFGDIEKELSEKKTSLNILTRLKENIFLSSVADPNSPNYDVNFSKYSKKGEALADERSWAESTKNIVAMWRNNPEKLKSWEISKDWFNEAMGESVLNNQIHYLAAKYMTETEFAIYNYYLAKETEGSVKKGAAEKYLKSIQDLLTDRQGTDIAEQKDGMLSKYAYGYKAGVDQFTQGIINRFNTEDDYIPTTGTQKASGQIRADIKEEHGFIGQVGYDLINTTSNMLPSVLTSTAVGVINPVAGTVVGATLMGTSASGNAYQEMLNLGYDKKQANTYSILVGVSEAALSYAFSGISALGGKLTGNVLNKVISRVDNAIAKFAIEFGGKVLSEGLEEAAQEILTPIFENIAVGYEKNSIQDINWEEVVYSGLLGMLSAVGSSAVETTKKLKNSPEYQRTTANEEILKLVNKVKNGDFKAEERVYLESATPEVVQKIKDITGIDVTGFKVTIEARQIEHILKDHGAEGKTDHSMSDDVDIAKIEFTLSNPDSIVEAGTTRAYVSNINGRNKPAKTVLYEKVVGDKSYYAVEAVPDTAKKTLYIVSAFIGEPGYKKEASQTTDAISPDATPNSETVNASSNNNISHGDNVVNTNISTEAENNSETQADFSESANFMPESDASSQGEIGLSEPTTKEIHRAPTREEEYAAIIGQRKDAKQRHILDVAKKLDNDLKVVFVDPDNKRLSGRAGVYIRETKTIYLSNDNSIVGMYCELFKHEFVHRLESKKAYQSFKNYLFRNSSAFEQFVRARLKKINGTEFDGTREEALKALSDYYIDLVRNGEFTAEYKRNFTAEYAEREMVADFVGKVLFKGKENHSDIAQSLADSEIDKIISLEDTFAEFENLNETERGFIRRIVDAIKDFISSLRGVNQNKRLVEDLEYIEQRLSRVLDSKDTKKAANNSGKVMYKLNSYSEQQINNWKESKNIVVYENEQQLRGFISDAAAGKNLNKKIYFGAISKELADRIKQDTGIDVNKYNCTLRASEVRKILKDHGKEEKEALRGQRAITEDDFVLIPQIIQNSDKIILSDELFEGKPVIHFIKTINGKTTIAAYVSAKHLDLTVQTMYSGKNKGNLSIVAGEQAPANTPEANAGTVSNNSISEKDNTVNTNLSNETQNYSETQEKTEGSFSLETPAQQMRENLERYESGKISREEYLEENDRLWGEANEKYGTIEQGENAEAPISTPKAISDDKLTERFIRTVIETGKLNEEMIENVEAQVLLGEFSYKAISDDKATKVAEAAVNNGTAEDIWEEAVNVSKGVNKNQIAVGERLLANAIESGNTLRVLEISSELADIFTRAGQVVQAARLLKKMTGAGKLVAVQRTVKMLNRDMRKKYGEDRPNIKISPEAAKRLANAKTEKGIEHAYQEILQEVADQVPVTWLDKWNAWRYWAMLSNPKTHIRNVVGNAIFIPATRIRYFMAASIESAKIKDNSRRTKSVIIKKEYRDFAEKDSKRSEVKQLLKGNKYNDKTALKEKQQIFKNKALEFLTRFNSNALEAEDMLFKNKHYIHALAGFLQARNVSLETVSQDVLDEARIYAVNEARKATFNDESALANWIQNFGNRNLATNIMVEGVLPFKRTPVNIVKRGVEYSPIGLVKTLTKGVYDVKKGKITATEFIDGLASGLTGTGIMLVGMLLANLGLISGGEDDDKESAFEKWLGKQEYAIEFAGKSYTIDWAAPACIPFFIGAEIVNTLSAGEEFNFADISSAIWNSLEPITNLSMLSGMQGVIESTRYAEPSQILSSIAGDTLTSYAMQGIPSISGAVSRTIDPTQRSWYTDKNSKWFDGFTQSIGNNIKSKIPGLSYTQIPKIDPWGREVSRGNVGERIIENFVSPGYYSEIEYNETNEELQRLFVKTGGNVLPKAAAKSFSVNGETKHLTPDEYVAYAKAKGEYSFDYVKDFMDNSAYKKLSDEERAEVIENLYEYANAKAKSKVTDYDLMAKGSKYKTVTNWERNGGSAVLYYISRAMKK